MGRRLTYTILAAALLLSLPAAAQHYIGAKGGYGAAWGRFYPPVDKSPMVWGKYTGGVMWKYYSEQAVIGGVSAELEYQMRGYRIVEGIMSDTTTYKLKTRTVGSVTVPLIWQPHLYFANRHIRVFLNAGVTFSYNLGIKDTYTVTDYRYEKVNDKSVFSPEMTAQKIIMSNRTVTSVTTPYKMVTARDNRWNYGLCGGFGFGVLFGRWEVFAEGRYYFGMSDIIRNKTKYIFNKEGAGGTIRSELDNLFINAGFFFRLGKEGIKAPPLRRSKDKVPDNNDFRNIKLTF